MVWRLCSHDGLYELQRISERMGSAQYQATLYEHLTPFGSLLGGENLIFQQGMLLAIHLNPPRNGFEKKNLIFFVMVKWKSRLEPHGKSLGNILSQSLCL
ncbi:hypothetical protein AVEN_34597-1 [Araneus ventricosus]|uniref:Uncharacterized protein n=1 Tax=Araneus ventricosus TaxID=182803 RepID=A0A4Y2B0P0_ARAVE|nr:hypothetical protein AVEN_34597-1 [Araneus ventricosus]